MYFYYRAQKQVRVTRSKYLYYAIINRVGGLARAIPGSSSMQCCPIASSVRRRPVTVFSRRLALRVALRVALRFSLRFILRGGKGTC